MAKMTIVEDTLFLLRRVVKSITNLAREKTLSFFLSIGHSPTVHFYEKEVK